MQNSTCTLCRYRVCIVQVTAQLIASTSLMLALKTASLPLQLCTVVQASCGTPAYVTSSNSKIASAVLVPCLNATFPNEHIMQSSCVYHSCTCRNGRQIAPDANALAGNDCNEQCNWKASASTLCKLSGSWVGVFSFQACNSLLCTSARAPAPAPYIS